MLGNDFFFCEFDYYLLEDLPCLFPKGFLQRLPLSLFLILFLLPFLDLFLFLLGRLGLLVRLIVIFLLILIYEGLVVFFVVEILKAVERSLIFDVVVDEFHFQTLSPIVIPLNVCN